MRQASSNDRRGWRTSTFDGSPYLVTELLQGESLRQRLLAGAVSLRKAVQFGLQIVQGLAAAQLVPSTFLLRNIAG